MKGWQVALAASAVLLGCGRKAELEACNIARRTCQEDIYYDVVRLRGDGWDPFQGVPPIRTISLAAYRKQLIAEQAPQPQASASASAAAPKVDPWEVALHLLGLIRPTTSTAQASIDDRISNVAAFYASATGEVTVLDRGDEHNDAADTTLLAHELVHAFQYNEQSAGAGRTSTDGAFADQALVEGEAVLYEHFVGAELQGVAPQQVDWDRYYKGWSKGLRDNMPQQNSPYLAVSWFVYPFGAHLLTQAWLEGGNSAVRRLGTDFPRRSVDYMASLANVTVGHARALSCQVEAPGKSFALAVFDRFGAMQVYAFLGASGLDDASAWSYSLRWRDDLIWIYFDKASEVVALSWRIRFADRASADAAVAAVADKPSSMLKASRDGNDALIVGSDNADLLATWQGTTSCKLSL